MKTSPLRSLHYLRICALPRVDSTVVPASRSLNFCLPSPCITSPVITSNNNRSQLILLMFRRKAEPMSMCLPSTLTTKSHRFFADCPTPPGFQENEVSHYQKWNESPEPNPPEVEPKERRADDEEWNREG